MNMIEKVARALCVAGYNNPDTKTQFGDMWTLYIKDAKAAIEAMREPTEEMYLNYKTDKMWKELNSIEVYNRWIDAALKE